MYSDLYDICRKHYWHDYAQQGIVIPEPYIPHFPNEGDRWNGVLLQAEAQNLSDTNHDYRLRMIYNHNAGNTDALINRMNLSARSFPENYCGIVDSVHSDVAISPWKNGVMPFATSSVAKIIPESLVAEYCYDNPLMAVRQVAVSNAVPWSRIELNRQGNGFVNARPTAEAVEKSKQFWADMLVCLEDYMDFGDVMEIWTFGQVAYDVCTDAAMISRNRRCNGIRILKLPPPFQMNFNLNTDGFRDEAESFMPLVEADMHELVRYVETSGFIRLAVNVNLARSLGAVTVKRYLDKQLSG